MKTKIQELLIQQYLLHEIQHHPPATRQGSSVVMPIAHTLIDIYKCLHQGEFGIGHSIDNPTSFRERLIHEFQKAEANPDEPLMESVSPDASVVRINFRPYRNLFKADEEKGCELLFQACIEAAKIEKGSVENFFTTLYTFRELNCKNELAVGKVTYAFPPEMVESFFIEIDSVFRRIKNIPVLSHSPVYRHFNAPSYRVIDMAVIQHSPLAEYVLGVRY